jgi:signal transduction histidine kinase/CheY-like chemotaxis protein
MACEDITNLKRAEEALRRSEQAATRLAQGNAIMAEIGRIISSTLSIEEVYERFAEEVLKLIPFDRIAINIINPKDETVTVAYATGLDIEGRRAGDVVSLPGTFTEEVMRTGSSLLIQTEDPKEIIDRLPGLSFSFQAGFRSMISVPLISKDQVIGVLHFRSIKPYAYSERDLRLGERVGNQIAGAIANAQLYAERKRAEDEKAALQEQLRQSQKMEAVGRLAGGIAHDFSNLLTVIKGFSQLSRIELKEGSPLRGNIDEIQNAAERAASLTRQLLAFSRRQVMEMKVLDLNALLRDLDKMLRRVIGEDVDLVTLLAEDLGRVKADPGQIEQVIMNLAVNARDAMPNGGKLTIETANVDLDESYARSHAEVKPGRYVMFSVSDTGVGMTPEVKERIFEPFFTTKEVGKGTGLGLSTAYGIVKQSDGNIWVYSEPEKGTTFKIYLTRVEETSEEAGKEAVAQGLPRGDETILVVEDEEKVRKLIVGVLTQQGYKVLEASYGDDALTIHEKHKGRIHLMLVDVIMPGMSGPELAKRLGSLNPKMKVLYMSGYTDSTIVHHGVLEKGVNYVQKPFTMDGLARKVREVLDKSSN